jgi:hypothetical protein
LTLPPDAAPSAGVLNGSAIGGESQVVDVIPALLRVASTRPILAPSCPLPYLGICRDPGGASDWYRISAESDRPAIACSATA